MNLGDVLDKTIIEIYTENNQKMVHFFAYGYYSGNGTDVKNYRFVEYTFMIASVADVIKAGGLNKWESDNSDEYKQYITDCSADECVSLYEHYNDGKIPDWLCKKSLSENTPDGVYIVSEKPINFRMHTDIKFNRPIQVTGEDFISPGGYEMTIGEKKIMFDFENYYGVVDEKDASILHCILENPDTDAFPELNNLVKSDFNSISQIAEFYVYTGEGNESDLAAEKIISIDFDFPQYDYEKIEVSQSVIMKFNELL